MMESVNLTLEIDGKKSKRVFKNAKYIILLCENGETDTFLFHKEIEDDEEDEFPIIIPTAPKLRFIPKIQDYIN